MPIANKFCVLSARYLNPEKGHGAKPRIAVEVVFEGDVKHVSLNPTIAYFGLRPTPGTDFDYEFEPLNATYDLPAKKKVFTLASGQVVTYVKIIYKFKKKGSHMPNPLPRDPQDPVLPPMIDFDTCSHMAKDEKHKRLFLSTLDFTLTFDIATGLTPPDQTTTNEVIDIDPCAH